MTIQPGERWRTRDGRVAEIRAILGGLESYPVRAVVGKLEYCFDLSGRYNRLKPDPLDLIEKEPEPMTIDPNKQYRTRDGREVRIYAVEPKGPDPVHGAVKDHGCWYSYSWKASGAYVDAESTCMDLIEVKPSRYVWINVYESHTALWATREEADMHATFDRTHRIRVTIPNEPVWDEEETDQ